MAWLTSLLSKPATIDDERTPSAQDLPSVNENGAQPPPAAGSPPLAILAPDIAGISSFRLRFFLDAATAAADIEQLPPEMRRATHAFWALHDEPVLPPDGHREALVLIRANHTSNIVYAVSFTDMESAQSFARFEAKRGLDISHLIILWAAFATVRDELDGVSILPAAAPETKAKHASPSARRSAVELEATEPVREYERREEPTISNGAAAPEAPADEAKLAEAEAERREEAARRAEAEEATRITRQAQEELREARAAADAARAQAEAEAARRTEAEEAAQRAEAEETTRRAEAEEATRRAEAEETARHTEAEEAARRAEAEETARRAETEEAARIARQAQEELREARAAADAARAQAEAEATLRQEAERRLEEQTQAIAAARSQALAETKSSAAAEQRLTNDALDDGDEPAARGTVFAHAPAVETEEDTETVEIRADDSGDPADDLPQAPKLDEFDIAYEVARLLKNRRWEKREGPFQGFDSPPGKF